MKTTIWLITSVCSLLLSSSHKADARLTMQGDPLQALDATRVVIVKPDGLNIFRIEEILLDEDPNHTAVGGAIRLPGFKLLTDQEFGQGLIDSMTAGTRILLYLKRSPTYPDTWIITQSGYAFFWVQDPAGVGELRNKAQEAIRARKAWETARNTVGVQLRIEALWPFLQQYDRRFNYLAQKELQQIGAPAGDYLADKFEKMDSRLRIGFLTEFHLYNSDRLHRVLLQHLKNQQAQYEQFLKVRGDNKRNLIDDWNALPEEVKDTWSELDYGLIGLARFKDRQDLLYIRELALWAIHYRFKQTCDAALDAFREMPERANLPVIAAIWQEFSAHPYNGNAMSPLDVTRTLWTHRFPETVPLLVPFLKDKNRDLAAEARRFLTDIVGRDLGPGSEDWLAWYRKD